MQRTLKGPVGFVGTGLHSGRAVRMTVQPASAGYGIWFRRADLPGDALIAARWDQVVGTTLCTEIANGAGARVATIEHLMAALAGCGIQNALIEIDGPEVPILDGSSARFVQGFLKRGLREQQAEVMAIRVLEPVTVSQDGAKASLHPAEGLEIDFAIDFVDAAIGRQQKRLRMANGAFVRELADSRTFCRQADVERMQANGLARGGTMANAVVFDGDRVLSPGGLRHRDEPVRHKMLDALGDLALAGAPLLARYRGERAGHAMTNRLLRALFARPGAWELVTCGAGVAARLPGAGVGRADLAAVA
ncbi:UDP-3-O-acyl-N-acetylglucosamine deacetylase [Frigidibacter sp. ROC022]|uniref:UDP-3-O-acyl-N-acetylglucosamine deacetylase n=1 Tax=Frigidibacter sp. ROC022 TaxID=2971796 RepID=UPI00215A78F0|nr:UDP-3-O-acyl-N-acetylglucosamine deacetylase [Frigidibacter sp. ROC022]MCR8725237.1 UDP-3-O-acyl-N-acetylglucosamine deacetylase [Frigidibacter sp. ROC022]